MTSTSDLVDRLVNLVRSKSATTFYLNASPGAGKSHLLRELASLLPEALPFGHALGPYPLDIEQVDGLGARIMRDCYDAGFLPESPSPQLTDDLASTWRWFAKNAHIGKGRSFLVFIDLATNADTDISSIGRLFSNARCVEGVWSLRGIRVFHMFAGYWDHPALEGHFHRINTSFPYTIGQNYLAWLGLCAEEIVQLVQQLRPTEACQLHGHLLFELSGGHAAACVEIINQIESGNLNLPAMVSAALQAAGTGPVGRSLIEAWCRLPSESRSVLKQLLVQRHIVDPPLSAHSERLIAAGIAHREQVGNSYYLAFKSWYAELLVRLHAEALGIADEQTQAVQISELIPSVSEMNVHAYRLINSIENNMRNFAATQLLGDNTGRHILQNRCIKYHDHNGERTRDDAYSRATIWQSQSAQAGLPTTLNPLLAYCSTSDLAEIVEDIGRKQGIDEWIGIADSIRQLRYVRDAVMHNQIIDDAALERLYSLQASIYAALNEKRS